MNKVDHPGRYILPSTYYSLGTDFIFVSAEHAQGIDELLEQVKQQIQSPDMEISIVDESVRIAIIGKPNVGKSSIINKMINDEWVIVSPVPGTTRDSIDLDFRRNQQSFTVIDNAGIRKLKKVKEETESAAVIRAEKSMRSADVVVLVLDVSQYIDQNDLLIANKVLASCKPVIIAGNKSDLIQEKADSDRMIKEIKRKFNSLYFAPILLISAKTGKNIFQLIDRADSIHSRIKAHIKTSLLNETMKRILKKNRLRTQRGQVFNPKFVTIESSQPFFIKMYCHTAEKLRTSDEVFLKKLLVNELHLEGIPIFIKVVSKGK